MLATVTITGVLEFATMITLISSIGFSTTAPVHCISDGKEIEHEKTVEEENIITCTEQLFLHSTYR
jgi:hypothetical protein